jgi:hypothetical protein
MSLACELGREATVPASIRVVMGRLRSSDFDRLPSKRQMAINAFWSKLLRPASVEADGIFAFTETRLN